MKSLLFLRQPIQLSYPDILFDWKRGRDEKPMIESLTKEVEFGCYIEREDRV